MRTSIASGRSSRVVQEQVDGLSSSGRCTCARLALEIGWHDPVERPCGDDDNHELKKEFSDTVDFVLDRGGRLSRQHPAQDGAQGLDNHDENQNCGEICAPGCLPWQR